MGWLPTPLSSAPLLQLGNGTIDYEAELNVERNNVNLSLELLIIKINRLLNFWNQLQKVSSKLKTALNISRKAKGILKSIAIKIASLKDPFNKSVLETKVKNYNKVLLKLTRNSKANHFNNLFREGIR